MNKIIIIDDERINQIAIKRVLEKDGSFSVITASSADDGIEALKSESVDFVLLDIEMPGKNGFEAFSEIKAVTDAKIVFFTGSVDETIRNKANELGADGVITKPVTVAKLFEILSV